MNTIGSYKILHKLGEGGVGEVFKAVDSMLEREVAVKVLRAELSQREDVLQRFRSEAIALGRLNHPNIATVYAFAKDGERYYMALEYINGESLDRLLSRRKKLPWQEAVHYACHVLDGLEHAHRLNVIHRDVKPSNILVAHTGTVKIMDFGIARILEKTRQTKQGYLVGTLEYMSPEQIQGKEVDARADLYSFGIVLYEMITGCLPFRKNTEYDLLKAQIEETPQPPRFFAPDIPPNLENIILRSLAKKPADRFDSALKFATALRAIGSDVFTKSDFPPQTRLATPDFHSGFSAFPFKRLGVRYKLERIRTLCADYPIPILSLALMTLGATSLYFLLPPSILESADHPSKRSPQTDALQPSFNNISDTAPMIRTDNPQPAVHQPAADLPVALPKPMPLQRFEPEPLPISPPYQPVINESEQPSESKSRKSISSKPDITSKRRRVKTDKTAENNTTQAVDEDKAYWDEVRRSTADTKRTKPAAKSKNANQDPYWQNADRKVTEFLSE